MDFSDKSSFEQMEIISERENKCEDDTTEKNYETEKKVCLKSLLLLTWHIKL